MIRFAAGICAFALVASAASGATVSYMANIGVGQTNWNMSPTLPQWDPALFPGQTLQSVKLTVKGTVEGDARVESTDGSAATVNFAVAATITATAPGGLIVNVLPLAGGSFNATAFDGTLDFGGTSGQSLLNLTNQATISNMLTDPPDNLSAYIGNATISVPTVAVGSSSASGAGNLFSSFRTEAGAMLTIEYTFVPAPSAAALLGLGGLLAARRRR